MTEEQVRQIAATLAEEAAARARDEALAASAACCEEAKSLAVAADQRAQEAEQRAADAEEALTDHLATCHSLEIASEGVTAEPGWEVDTAEMRRIGGVHSVFLRLNRTGGDLVGVDAEWVNSEGKHEEGNIIPDLLIARVPPGWAPPQTYMPFGANSYGHGSIRVHGNGEVYLCDWAANNVIQDGYLVRIGYEFLAASPCEAA